VTYLLAVAVVFGVNLMPAFGPPTWALLVYFRYAHHLPIVPLVLLGALAAASGRLVLAYVFFHLRRKLPKRYVSNMAAAGKAMQRDRKRSALGLGLFALSPVPSAQLFEGAGLAGVPLLPLTGAFFVGRLISYSLYVGGAIAVESTPVGELVKKSFTSSWGIAIQVALLVALVLLGRVDWGKRLKH
jgi:membrane protein YqaA with SNARE-associated domain